MSKAKPNPVVHVKVPADLHARAKRVAVEERRTLASVLILALADFLARRA